MQLPFVVFAFGVKGNPYANFDLDLIQVVSAHFMKNTIAYSPLEFQFIGPYVSGFLYLEINRYDKIC